MKNEIITSQKEKEYIKGRLQINKENFKGIMKKKFFNKEEEFENEEEEYDEIENSSNKLEFNEIKIITKKAKIIRKRLSKSIDVLHNESKETKHNKIDYNNSINNNELSFNEEEMKKIFEQIQKANSFKCFLSKIKFIFMEIFNNKISNLNNPFTKKTQSFINEYYELLNGNKYENNYKIIESCFNQIPIFIKYINTSFNLDQITFNELIKLINIFISACKDLYTIFKNVISFFDNYINFIKTFKIEFYSLITNNKNIINLLQINKNNKCLNKLLDSIYYDKVLDLPKSMIIIQELRPKMIEDFNNNDDEEDYEDEENIEEEKLEIDSQIFEDIELFKKESEKCLEEDENSFSNNINYNKNDIKLNKTNCSNINGDNNNLNESEEFKNNKNYDIDELVDYINLSNTKNVKKKKKKKRKKKDNKEEINEIVIKENIDINCNVNKNNIHIKDKQDKEVITDILVKEYKESISNYSKNCLINQKIIPSLSEEWINKLFINQNI